ncbi:hypothetical protein [Streptomyces aidingensis]|uniref:Uncharacterized protein n=1 Tax=Streptomyces aidingensis TaxID=910347 RepID=A0A1I1ND69_9ACTN|nr:hypothetical protein [Streptomyces aidingensis]SFC93418.1 hypothetical protein SAMN05421773_107260 [Streptomyces aidingensis]
MAVSGNVPSRVLRAAVFAALCVLLAATGHIHSSGAPLPWRAPAAALPATALAAWFLTGRERGIAAVTCATVAAQTALHVVFSPAMAAGAPAGPAHHGPAGAEHSGHAAALLEHTASGHPSDARSAAGMAAAHLAAALLSGLWLAHGERAAFRLARVLTAWVVAPLRLFRRPPCPAPPPRRPAAARDRRPRRGPALRLVTTRGPPPGTAVV